MNVIVQYVSPFYDFARRKLHLPWKVVNRYLDAGAVASIEGKTVTLRASGAEPLFAHVPVGRGGHAARWVNEFNARSARFDGEAKL
jgi:hypothetical protein